MSDITEENEKENISNTRSVDFREQCNCWRNLSFFQIASGKTFGKMAERKRGISFCSRSVTFLSTGVPVFIATIILFRHVSMKI